MKFFVSILLPLFIFSCLTFSSQNQKVNFKIRYADSLFNLKKDSAVFIITHLIPELKRSNDLYSLASAYKSLGLFYYYQANFAEALKNYQESERLIEQNKFTDLEITLKNLKGTFYKKQKQYKKAAEEFEKGLKIARQEHDSSNMAGLLGDLGLVYLEQGNYRLARPYFENSLSAYLKSGNALGASYAYNYLAEVCGSEGNFKEALDLMKKALHIREELHDQSLVAVNLNNIAEIYFQENDFQNAILYLQKSIALTRELKYTDLLQHSLGLLSDSYSQTGNYKLAYEYTQQKNRLKDSIFNERNSKIIFEAEEKYQSARKQNEIDKLTASNVINEVKVSKQKNIILFFVSILFLVILALALISKYYRKVKKSHRIITEQQVKTEYQKKIIEEKQHEILDSINYAKRIQATIFAQDDFLKRNLEDDYFVLFKPKDIVSGDFYWATTIAGAQAESGHTSATAPTSTGNIFYLAVCDSTGHGVPGAFMSLLNIGYLSEAINEKSITTPGEVFNYVRQRLIGSVNKDGQKDGFDGILLKLETTASGNKTISYSAAYNSPLLVSNNKAIHLPADKMPVGIGEKEYSFNTTVITCEPGDTLYLYTDGYADQFGGEKGKKFKYKQLEELLLQINHLPFTEQRLVLDQRFEEWRGLLEQVDDVLLIGIKL